MHKKNFFFLIIALLLSILLGIYQRITGPTHPLKGKEKIAGIDFSYRLQRSALAGQNLILAIRASQPVDLRVVYKLLNSDFPDIELPFISDNEVYRGTISGQPAAAKISCRFFFHKNNTRYFLLSGQPVVIRFRNPVPPSLLIFHIIFMFLTPTLAFFALFKTIQKDNQPAQKYFLLAIITLICGGFILGPLVQKYAFGVYWSGFPFGKDLTDNKTLFQLIVWIIVAIFQKKKPHLISIAILAMLLTFLIPHSLFGSEYDFRHQILKK